ncbi:MAG: glycosyltransferase family 39 protein [Nitrososphaerota archaeon]
MDRKDAVVLVIIVITTYLFVFSIPPRDFPLSDDYAYYSEVKTFLVEGKFRMHHSATATSIIQILIGSVAASLLGLSHKTLMFTTMLLSAIPIAFAYIWFRIWTSRQLAALGSFAMLANPAYYYLSHTFMTDVYSLVFMVPSLLFLFKGAHDGKDAHIATGVTLALVGFWVRQYSILLIGGVILWYVYKLIFEKKNEFTFKRVTMLLVVPAINLAVWWYLFPLLHDLEHKCAYVMGLGGWIPKNMLQALLFTGYFLFPLGIAYLADHKALFKDFLSLKKYLKFFLIVVFAVLVSFMVLRTVYGLGNLWVPAMPFAYATANPTGVGATPLAGSKPYFFPTWLWLPICFLSVITAFGLVVQTLRNSSNPKTLMLLAFIFSVIVPQTFYGNFFDRYYLIAVPLVLPIVLTSTKNYKFTKVGLILTIVILGAWSWYGVYDNFSWNSARWEGIEYLLSMGVPEESIDGGMEYNARFFEGCNNINVKPVRWYGWSYSLSDEYIVSFSPLEDYDVLREISYSGPFGEKLGSIYVLKKPLKTP